jgi:acetyl-CoA synthetase
MRLGDEHIKKHDLSSLRLLGTVGEPINPEAWMWYHEVIGGERCPIVDTWWQTETGAIMITPLPGAVATKPGSATFPFPGISLDVVHEDGTPCKANGISLDVVHEDGTPCKANEGGYLVATKPWPSMMRTVWGDHERFKQTYWSQVEGCYFAGDGARKDEDGYFWVMGRIDDVVNVSGHRIGTMEVESSIVAHEATTEAAVVARPDDVTGQALVAFVTLKQGIEPNDEIEKQLRDRVTQDIGPFAKPKEIRFTDALPKTRSGKIMRRLLRELASEGKVSGDITTLEDLGVIAQLRGSDEG